MALIVIADVGAEDANSYATLAEAELYFEQHLYVTKWTEATTEQKNIALVQATRILDREHDWIGTIADVEQALGWPRVDVTDPEGRSLADLIPPDIKTATYEMALSLLQDNREAEADTQGISRMKIDVLEFQFDKEDRRLIIPDPVQTLLSYYSTNSSSAMTARLIRS